MLEKLDSVAWQEPDMPQSFRALLADDDAAWAEGRVSSRAYVVEEYDCYGTVVYGETVEKVAQALPFLLELLPSPAVCERHQLLQILGEVADACCVWRHQMLCGGLRDLLQRRDAPNQDDRDLELLCDERGFEYRLCGRGFGAQLEMRNDGAREACCVAGWTFFSPAGTIPMRRCAGKRRSWLETSSQTLNASRLRTIPGSRARWRQVSAPRWCSPKPRSRDTIQRCSQRSSRYCVTSSSHSCAWAAPSRWP
jgi:hypothetical protein